VTNKLIEAMARAMQSVLFVAVLRPLILRNYRLRSQGLISDRWYWADEVAMSWGKFVQSTEES